MNAPSVPVSGKAYRANARRLLQGRGTYIRRSALLQLVDKQIRGGIVQGIGTA